MHSTKCPIVFHVDDFTVLSLLAAPISNKQTHNSQKRSNSCSQLKLTLTLTLHIKWLMQLVQHFSHNFSYNSPFDTFLASLSHFVYFASCQVYLIEHKEHPLGYFKGKAPNYILVILCIWVCVRGFSEPAPYLHLFLFTLHTAASELRK